MYREPRNNLISFPLIWKVAVGVVVLYLILVAIGDVLIYKKGTENGYTHFIENFFPFPAGVVDHQIIPLSRYRRETAALMANAQKHNLPTTKLEVQQLVINKLINRSLYEQELAKNGITISDQDIQSRLDEIYKEIGGKDKLAAFLKDNYGDQLSVDDFRLFIKQFLLEYAIEHKLLTRVTVRHILIAVPDNASAAQVETLRQKALQVKAKITDPSQFAAVAKEYSEDTNSRDKGGELGTTFRGSDQPVYSPEFEQTIFSLPIGQVSDPVRSPVGWHIVLVDKKEGDINLSMKDYTDGLLKKHKVRAFVPPAAK